jgi:hypothetical protein
MPVVPMPTSDIYLSARTIGVHGHCLLGLFLLVLDAAMVHSSFIDLGGGGNAHPLSGQCHLPLLYTSFSD